MMAGEECPECGKRLGVSGACLSCNWRPANGGSGALTRTCTRCEKARRLEIPGQPSSYPCEHCGAVSANFCHQCGTRSGSTTPTDDGRRLCPTCRLAAVRAIVSQQVDLCVDCGIPVSVHVEEFRALAKRIETQMTGQAVPAEWHSRPSLLERAGVHRPRNKAVAARLAAERSPERSGGATP